MAKPEEEKQCALQITTAPPQQARYTTATTSKRSF